MSGTKKEVALTSKLRAKQRRRRRNVIIGAAVAVALCAGGGGVAFAATRPTPVDYRTATAKTGDVTETVNLTGTIASVNKRNVAFQTAGTVGSVQVALGQKVTAGQVLAAMDPASLTAAVTDAQQTVTKANQTLADDLASQTAVATPTTSAAPSSSTATSSASSSSSKSTSSSSASSSAETAAVQAAAKAVTA
ncbi:MAG: trimeric autotransporter adhesin, partial [Microbacteriaceae bacterium]|nr:trimeric autotransporter adhesin [Microbacteriaceae bacterium]